MAEDVIDYLPVNEAEKVLDNWLRKIRLGGKIILGGVDLHEVCKALFQYRIELPEANRLIHGEQNHSYLIRRANFTCSSLADFISQNYNFKIIKKRINDYKMIVEAKRNENNN